MNGISDKDIFFIEDAIQRLARVAGWELDVATSLLFWTEELYNICEVEQDFIPTLESAILLYHPDDREKVKNAVAAAIERGDSYAIEARLITGKSRTIWTRSIGGPIFDDGKLIKVVGAFQDISIEKQLTAEIDRNRYAYLKIAHGARAMIWRAEPGTHRFISISENCHDITGYTQSEWLKIGFWQDHLHPDDKEKTIYDGKKLTTKQIDHVLEYRMLKADGSETWVSDSISLVKEGDRVIELVGVMVDVTALMHARHESAITAARLKTAYRQTLQAIAYTIEKRDPYTSGHMNAVANLASKIASRLTLSPEIIDGLVLGASIHDIGKIYLPAEILNRPGKLSKEEFELIKTHAAVGYEIVKDIDVPWPVAEMVRSHHERLDGTGYPDGLKGDQISIETRIISVADVVEAFSAHRPYRPAKKLDEARAYIIENSGTLFDPKVVAACVDIIDCGEFQPSA